MPTDSDRLDWLERRDPIRRRVHRPHPTLPRRWTTGWSLTFVAADCDEDGRLIRRDSRCHDARGTTLREAIDAGMRITG